MKVKQTVTAKFHSCYTGWNSMNFTDEAGNEIEIRMTDDNYLHFEKYAIDKADRIRKERAEAVAEAQRAEEAKESDNE